MTVTFNNVTVTGVSTDGGGSSNVTSSSGRRVLAAKTDSVSNVNNNNNNINMHNNNNGPAVPSSVTAKASVVSVRRVLFGTPADPAETRAWLDRQLCAAVTSDSRAWNFDFINERPLRDSPADRYMWERVSLPTPPAPPAQQQQPQRHEQQQQADQRVCAIHRTRQSKVTDFMKQSKKRSFNAMMTAGSLKSNNKKVADGESPATAAKRSRRSIMSTMAI